MKTIKFKNGQILYGYELTDLEKEARDRVINDYIDFEIEVMDENSSYYHCAVEMDEMQTPWFLAEKIWEDHKEDIIESIKINNHLFDEDGEMIPIYYYTRTRKGKTKITKILYKDKEVEISDK